MAVKKATMAVALRAAVLVVVSIESIDAAPVSATLDAVLDHDPELLAQLAANCREVTEDGPDAACYEHVQWAKETGAELHPDWYTSYPVLSIDRSFKAWQWVLSVAAPVMHPDIEDNAGGHDCPPPCNYFPPPCKDVAVDSPGECYHNVEWAQLTGIYTKPEWYEEWPTLNSASSFNDFQYVLHEKIGPGNGTGWECPMPCQCSLCSTSSTTSSSTTPLVYQAPPIYYTATTTLLPEESFPWWAWLLCVLAVLACCGLLAGAFYFLRGGKKSPQKKTRKLPAQQPAQENPSFVTNPNMASSVVTPSYTSSFQSTGYGAPILPAQATPVAMAQPAEASRCPSCGNFLLMDENYCRRCGTARPAAGEARNMAMAQPTAGYGQVMSPEQAAQLFDQLDTNRDGTLSRAEFSRMMQQS